MPTKNNLTWHTHRVTKSDRENIKKHKACVLWFTGLSASGKSTIAHELEHTLNSKNIHTYILDGDNVRHGLNKNLGFSKEDREENIRRVGEITKLFTDAGIVTIAAFISPFVKDRKIARGLVKDIDFVEIYTKCPVSVCQSRDPKGLYKKAISGELKEFTGISHPYEEPIKPEILLETDKLSIEQCVDKIMSYLESHKIIKNRRINR